MVELSERLSGIEESIRDVEGALSESKTKMGRLSGSVTEKRASMANIESKIHIASIARQKLTENPSFNLELASKLFNDLSEEFCENFDLVVKKAEERSGNEEKMAQSSAISAAKILTDLCARHDIPDKSELLQLEPIQCLQRCRDHTSLIEESELTQYKEDAEAASTVMLSNFRSSVAVELKANVDGLKQTFRTLNRSLVDLCFNNTQYQFSFAKIGQESIQDVLDYIDGTSEFEHVDDLLDGRREHPALKIIEQLINDGRLNEIADYRNFYSYDIKSRDIETGTERYFSQLLKVGSGGEKQTPFYVALGASFMNAFNLNVVNLSDKINVSGGAAFAFFDEAMSKMDGANTASALEFFRSIGLQVILAAPPDAAVKISNHVDRTLTVIRAGADIYLDEVEPSDFGRALLESDNPYVHESVVHPYMEQLVRESGGK